MRKFKVRVSDWESSWGTFIYTEAEIEIDRKNGFEVEILAEVFE